MMTETLLHLFPASFPERERVLVEHGPLTASVFRYDSGVCGLRLKNELGELALLPFQGQQIWSAAFGGRDLTMKSMFSQPNATRNYLETYGGFMIHCGATRMGVPSAGDNHPLHGELPNAPYQRAWLAVGEDARGAYIELSGEYEHIVAFSDHYIARPQVRLYANSAIFPVSIAISNLKKTPMDLMYLAHANFRPVDDGRLIYSAVCDAAHVRVRKSIPSHVKPLPGYAEFLVELAERPERHNVLSPGLAFDPEVVFFVDYLADAQGWAHTLQIHPDGSADYISHRPDQLNHGVRWICRTPDQDALGMCLPATAEPEGYTAEKAKGNVRSVPGGATVRFDMEMGYLSPAAAAQMAEKIGVMIGRANIGDWGLDIAQSQIPNPLEVHMKRYGQQIGVKPEALEAYKRYHAAVWPGVLKMIYDCNIRNYTIFEKDHQLFAYFEYIGEDFAADMAKMAADPETQRWWAIMEPMQQPIATRAAGEWWANMEEVFHTD